MTVANLGGLVIAAALLSKSDVLKDILPVTPTTPPDEVNERPICGVGERLVFEAGNWVCIPKL